MVMRSSSEMFVLGFTLGGGIVIMSGSVQTKAHVFFFLLHTTILRWTLSRVGSLFTFIALMEVLTISVAFLLISNQS